MPLRRARRLAFTILGFIAVLEARADIVHLRDGRIVEGKVVSEDKDRVTLETRTGLQEVARSQIAEIERVKTAWEEYRERVTLLDPKDADGHYRLAVWCRSKKLDPEATAELRKAIEIDPDHANARKDLGFVKTAKGWVKGTVASKSQARTEKPDSTSGEPPDRGPIPGFGRVGHQWMTPDDQKEAEAGKVRYGGIWMSPEDRDKRKQGQIEEGGRWMKVEEADVRHQVWASAWDIETTHFVLRTNTSRAYADEIAELLELAFPEYARLFGGPPKKRLTLFLFKMHSEFKDYLNSHKLERFIESDSLFYAQDELVLCWSGNESDFIRRFVLGQVAWEYYYVCYQDALPSWLSDAVSFYFRTNKLEQGVLTPGLPNRVVLKDFDLAVRESKLIPLAKMMRMELQEAEDRDIIETYDAESYLLYLYLVRGAPPQIREKFQTWMESLKKAPFIMGNADLLSADWWRDSIGADKFTEFERGFIEWAKAEVASELGSH